MVPSRIASLFRRRQLRSMVDLTEFVRAEATRVAQVSLFTYLKARMGTNWPTHFEDPAYAPALSAAQRNGFLLCLTDLTLHVAACIGDGRPDQCLKIAIRLFGSVAGSDPITLKAFAARAGATNWTAARGTAAFRASAAGLVEIAPVSDAFRTEDRDAFSNAVALRWAEVRRKLKSRVDFDAVRADLAVD